MKLKSKAALAIIRRFWVQAQAFLCVLAPVSSHSPKTHTFTQLKTENVSERCVCVSREDLAPLPVIAGIRLQHDPGGEEGMKARVDPCWSCEIQKDALMSERDVSL